MKEVQVTIRVPEPGDALPFYVLGQEGMDNLHYDDSGMLFWGNHSFWQEGAGQKAHLLGLPARVEVDFVHGCVANFVEAE